MSTAGPAPNRASRVAATVLAAAGALLLAPVPRLAAQSSVSGVVIDAGTGRPVADVTLRIDALGRESVSDERGRFRFPGLGAGRHLLLARHLAYAPRSDTLVLTDDQHLDLELRLSGSPLGIDPLHVTARSRLLLDAGFYQRRDRGLGEYFTRDDIGKRSFQRLSDLLITVPGFKRTIRADGTSSMDARGKKSIVLTCNTQYFIDGIRADLAATDIDNLGLEGVEGIEVYRGSAGIPLQYGADRGACGAVLIWMRKR
jgi:hypothetical protein